MSEFNKIIYVDKNGQGERLNLENFDQTENTNYGIAGVLLTDGVAVPLNSRYIKDGYEVEGYYTRRNYDDEFDFDAEYNIDTYIFVNIIPIQSVEPDPTSPSNDGRVRIRVGNEWKYAIPWVRVNGSWKQSRAYVRVGSSWKITK